MRDRIEELRAGGVGIAIVDAITNDDLLQLGPALAGLPLVTGGSGVAIGLPGNWGIEPSHEAADLLYFALVTMARGGVDLPTVEAELLRRNLRVRLP